MSTKYTAFTREQIEAALPGDGWREGELAGSEVTLVNHLGQMWFIRCYIGVSCGSDQSREAGSDAIRFILIDAVSGKPRDKGVRVHRTGTVESLRERFAERVAKLVETAKAEQSHRCKRCGAMTTERVNKQTGERFRGCANWKNCKAEGATNATREYRDRLHQSEGVGRQSGDASQSVNGDCKNTEGSPRVAGSDRPSTPNNRRSELQAAGITDQPGHSQQHTPTNKGGRERVSELATALTARPTKRTPTVEQAAIIAAAKSGVKVLIVQAGAGTGKTSTDVMLSEALGGRGQYTAFNAPLCAEAKAKMPLHVAVNTIHSLAFRAEGHKYKHRLNTGRVKSEEVAKMLGLGALEFVGKRLAPGFLAGQVLGAARRFCNSADAEIGEQHFTRIDGLDQPNERTNNSSLRVTLLPFARKAWEDMRNPNGRLPFTHDAYAKVWQLNHPVIAADYLLVDEAQDLVPRDLAIIAAQECQVILVGDDAQTIYAWRGCVNAMSAFPDAPRLLLSQSFRFGEAIAAVANAVLETLDEPTALRLKGLPSIQSKVITGVNNEREQRKHAEGIEDANGDLQGGSARSDRTSVERPHDVSQRVSGGGRTQVAIGEGVQTKTQGSLATILCRTNACAVGNLLAAIAEGKRPFLVGGGTNVIAFVEGALALKEGRGTSHPELACFGSWGEVEEYASLDEGEDLRLMVKLIKEFGCRAILDALRRMPEEKDADLIISTAHKSKGREWDHVQLASDFPTKSKCGDPERKLLYVAVTRAKLVLDVSGCPFFTGKDSLDVSNPKGANDEREQRVGQINNEQVRDISEGDSRRRFYDGGGEQAISSDMGLPASGGAQAAERGVIQAGGQTLPQVAGSGVQRSLPIEFTWSKKDDRWLIRGAKGQSGVVTVTKKSGRTSQERLGKMVEEIGFNAFYEVANRYAN